MNHTTDPAPAPAPADQNSAQKTSNGRRRAPLGKYVIVLAAMLAVAVLAWRYADRMFPPRVPEIDLNDATPRVAEGIQEVRDAVVQHPRSAEAWGRLGMMLQAHEYPAKAMECYRQAARLQPDEFRWPYLLGSLLEGTEKEEAIAAYRQAIEIQPEIAQLRVKLADTLIQVGQSEVAEPELRRALELAPAHPFARFLSARLLFQSQAYQECLQLLGPLAQEPPPRRGVVELLTQVYSRLGEQEKAKAESERLQALPQSPDYWPDPYLEELSTLRRDSRWLAYQAKLLFDRGEAQATIDLLKMLVDEQPDDLMLREQLARAYYTLNRFDLAAGVLDEGIRRNPDAFVMLSLRGAVHMMQDEWKQAAERYQKSVAIKPDDASSHQDLGMCFLQLGDPANAMNEFREAVRYQADLIGARIEIAKLLLNDSKWQDAERELRTVLDLSPENAAAGQLLKAATEKTPPASP